MRNSRAGFTGRNTAFGLNLPYNAYRFDSFANAASPLVDDESNLAGAATT